MKPRLYEQKDRVTLYLPFPKYCVMGQLRETGVKAKGLTLTLIKNHGWYKPAWKGLWDERLGSPNRSLGAPMDTGNAPKRLNQLIQPVETAYLRACKDGGWDRLNEMIDNLLK